MHRDHGEPPISVDENSPLEQRLLSSFFRFMHTPWHLVPAPGLTRAETGILIGIEHNQDKRKPIRVRDLARIMRVSSPTATQHLNKLEDSGFIRREQSKDDRREVLIMLTESGRKELQAHRSAMDQNIRDLIDTIGEDNADRLYNLLTRTSDFFFEKEKTTINRSDTL